MPDARTQAIDVLNDLVPLSISSAWDEAVTRHIVGAMLAFADRQEQLLEAALMRAEAAEGQLLIIRLMLDQARPEGR